MIEIYTDGSCDPSTGRGGWAAIVRYEDHEEVLQGGYSQTTNFRMELIAIINALWSVTAPSAITVFTDTKLACDALNCGDFDLWKKNGWKRKSGKKLNSADLWKGMAKQIERHKSVAFVWIKAHQGHAENNYCDRLSGEWKQKEELPVDQSTRKELAGRYKDLLIKAENEVARLHAGITMIAKELGLTVNGKKRSAVKRIIERIQEIKE